jgi:acyl-CoA thioester hydrolase
MKNSPNSENSPNRKTIHPGQSGLKNHIEIEERVRYSETDQMGVAHNKVYFEWFEIGRTEYCRQKQIPYKDIEARGFYLVVVEAFCRYKRPLRYDDCFFIRIFLEEVTPKKVVFSYELLARPDRKLIAHGYTVHIVTNGRAEVCSLPDDLLEKIKTCQVSGSR